MELRISSPIHLLLALGLTIGAGACSDDDRDSGTTTKKDASTDAGTGLDSGVHPDANIAHDAGITCDPTNGTGCDTTQNKYCVYTTSVDEAQCREIGPQTHEQQCSTVGSSQACVAGYTCTQMQGDPNAMCYKVCVPGSSGGCAGLTGSSQTYTCNSLVGTTGAYGLCIGQAAAACDPITDDCPATETCSWLNNALSCETQGTAQTGGDCSATNCAHGQGICLNGTCLQACDPNNPVCATGTCQTVPGGGFGVCTTAAAGCNMITDDCPATETCSATQNGLECVTSGAATRGAACDINTNNCAHGQGPCLDVGDGQGAICHEPCDPNAPACTGTGTCQSLTGLPYGVCVDFGGTCDPIDPNACPATESCTMVSQTDTGCTPQGTTQMGGSCASNNCAHAQGICLDIGSGATCYEACNTTTPACSSGDCLGLKGIQFGICVISACTPFSNPCPTGNNCSFKTGSGTCTPHGAVAAGASCTAADCAANLVCVSISAAGAMCYPPCDAQNACGTGQCAMLNGLDFGVCQ